MPAAVVTVLPTHSHSRRLMVVVMVVSCAGEGQAHHIRVAAVWLGNGRVVADDEGIASLLHGAPLQHAQGGALVLLECTHDTARERRQG